MKKVMFAVVAVAFVLCLVYSKAGIATSDIAKKEGNAPCTKCHVKPVKGDENLNDVGKCYKEKSDLKACDKDKKK